MPQTRAAAETQSLNGNRLRLSNVDWGMYSRLLRLFAERPGLRFTYDQGELEIMSPLLEHDDDSRHLFMMVSALVEELRIPMKPGGSTTIRRRLSKKGIEPDECFWLTNAPKMAGIRRLDLARDPPPDLAIEVDVTHSSLNRMRIYAALNVSEVWLQKGTRLVIHVLVPDGKYQIARESRHFPGLTPKVLMRYLRQFHRAPDVTPVIRSFRQWVRRKLVRKG